MGDLEAMIAAIIDKASIPGRHREPRLASELVDAERVDVGTPHGDLVAWRVGAGPARCWCMAGSTVLAFGTR